MVCQFGMKAAFPGKYAFFFFLGQALQSWQKMCLHSCRESQAPEGLDVQQLWDNAASKLCQQAAMPRMCPAARAGSGCPQGSASGPATYRWGQRSQGLSVPALVRTSLRFIPLSCQECQKQTTLFLLKGIKTHQDCACCSFLMVTHGRFISPPQPFTAALI